MIGLMGFWIVFNLRKINFDLANFNSIVIWSNTIISLKKIKRNLGGKKLGIDFVYFKFEFTTN